MKRRLLLEHTIGDLSIAPYLEGLRTGLAIAKHCSGCRRTTFPPEHSCPGDLATDGASESSWTELSGRAHLELRTDGPDGCFALVRFEGADNRAVCRIANPEVSSSTLVLQPDEQEIPGIVVMIVEDPIESTR